VFAGDTDVGEVTSGTMSPLIKQGIALALVHPDHAEEGGRLEVEVRGKRLAAEVVPKPFYDPSRYGRTRERT
jgi:aminomethyltransferase